MDQPTPEKPPDLPAFVVYDCPLSPFDRRVACGMDVITALAFAIFKIYALPFWALGYLAELFHVSHKDAEDRKDRNC